MILRLTVDLEVPSYENLNPVGKEAYKREVVEAVFTYAAKQHNLAAEGLTRKSLNEPSADMRGVQNKLASYHELWSDVIAAGTCNVEILEQ